MNLIYKDNHLPFKHRNCLLFLDFDFSPSQSFSLSLKSGVEFTFNRFQRFQRCLQKRLGSLSSSQIHLGPIVFPSHAFVSSFWSIPARTHCLSLARIRLVFLVNTGTDSLSFPRTNSSRHSGQGLTFVSLTTIAVPTLKMPGIRGMLNIRVVVSIHRPKPLLSFISSRERRLERAVK